jgi:hypothetical protein
VADHVRLADMLNAHQRIQRQFRAWQAWQVQIGRDPHAWHSFRRDMTQAAMPDPGDVPPWESLKALGVVTEQPRWINEPLSSPYLDSYPNSFFDAWGIRIDLAEISDSPGERLPGLAMLHYFDWLPSLSSSQPVTDQTSVSILMLRILQRIDRTLPGKAVAEEFAAMLTGQSAPTSSGETGTPQSANPLAAARQRGEQAKRDILALQGDMLNSAEVATRLGLDGEEVERRRQDGLLLALPTEANKYGFPVWQFRDGGVLSGLEDVLGHMSVRSPWMRAQFFLTGDLRLNGRTPLEMLLRGEVDAVRRAAAAYGEQLAS